MDNSRIFVGLDIGSTQIKVIAGQRDGRGVTAIGTATVPSNGLKQGVIVDIDQTAQAIQRAVLETQEKSNFQIVDLVVGLPANQLEIRPAQGVVSVSNPEKRITFDEIFSVTRQALGQSLSSDREVVAFDVDEFIVDGFNGIKDPHDMVGVRLEVRGTSYIGSRTIVENIRMAVAKAGLQINQLVLTPLTLGSTILNESEQEFGTVIVDMGGDQTTASVIHNSKLKFTYVDSEGGDDVTRDISEVLHTSMSNAEKLKRDYGFADASQASKQEQVVVTAIDGSQPKQISQNYLSEIIQAREEQIFNDILKALTQAKALEMPGGIILTGGAAAMPRISDLAKKIFNKEIKLFIPDQIGLRHPAYTRSLSYVSYASKLTQTEQVINKALENLNGNNQMQQPQASNANQMQPNSNTNQISNNQKASSSQKLTDRIKNLFQSFFD